MLGLSRSTVCRLLGSHGCLALNLVPSRTTTNGLTRATAAPGYEEDRPDGRERRLALSGARRTQDPSAERSCTSPSTIIPGWPTSMSSRTSGRRPRSPSCGGRSRSTAVRGRVVDALMHLAEAEKNGNAEEAMQALLRVISFDPYAEFIYRKVMAHYGSSVVPATSSACIRNLKPRFGGP